MNKVYNVIWSSALNALVVVAEGTKSRSKSTVRGLRVLVAFLLLAPATGMSATLPQGGMISIGEGTIVNSGSGQMIIKQSTDKLGINWQSFNVGADGQVIFQQPDKNSVALNRVIGSDASSILGKIEANGQVFLINPNGVIFGKDSKVNVGGLVASTLDISDENFINGNYQFSAGSKNGEIINNGTLQAAEGGYVAVLGKSVKNNGLIKAQLGTAALAAGDAVTLDFSGDGLINVQVDKSAVNALASNHGMIQADGGNVLMTARATNALMNTVVNNDGLIQAQTINHKSGSIFLDGGPQDGSGVVMIGGTLDASAPLIGDGGFIETSGKNIQLGAGVKVTTLAKNGATGQWLIDPTDFNIVAGSGAQTVNSMGADTLSDALEFSNVTLATSSTDTAAEKGDINVKASVTWDASTTLTLNAHNDINIADKVTINGDTGGLALNYSGRVNVVDGGAVKLNGANTTYSENGANFEVLRTADDLKVFSDNGASYRNFVLGGDIDASAMSTWDGGKGFTSFGNADTDAIFNMTLNGLGNTITDFYVNRPDQDYVGLLGGVTDSHISNINITGTAIGKDGTGLLVGKMFNSTATNVSSTGGIVSGGKWVGGLIGVAYSGNTIENLSSGVNVTGTGDSIGGALGYSDSNTLIKGIHGYGNVTGYQYTGGAMGSSFADENVMDISSGATSVVTGEITTGGAIGAFSGSSGTLTNVSGSGVVNGNSSVGGALGYGYGSMVNLKSDATVNGNMSVGGLVGEMYHSSLSESFATGAVNGTNDRTGGLVGTSSGSTIFNSLSTGTVTGKSNVGGFIGQSYEDNISTSFSTSNVSGEQNIGGFVGTTSSSVLKDVYATGEVSASVFYSGGFAGVSWGSTITNAYSTGKVSSPGSFNGGFMGSSNSDTLTNVIWDTDKSGYATSAGGVGKTSAEMMDSSTFAGWGVSTDGGADSSVWRIYEGKTGPLLKFLMGSANAQQQDISTTYNASAYTPVLPADMNSVTNVVYNSFFASLLDVTADGLMGGDFAGSPSMINAGSYSASSLYSGQFGLNITQDNVGQVVIEKAHLDFTANADNKVYDTTTSANAYLTANGLGSDILTVSGFDAAFADKNAGNGKTVTINGITITGDAVDNYTWDTVTTTADISKANLSVTGTGVDKTYDGTLSADVNLGYAALGGDSVLVSHTGANFADKNAGSGKVINVDGYTISGADADNYTLVDAPATVTADISKRLLSVDAMGSDKVYDGTTAGNISLSDDRIAGDVINLDAVSNDFADKNAGADKTLTATGVNIQGTDSDNYYLADTTVSTTATITKRNFTVSANTADKTYDGTVNADTTLSIGAQAGADGLVAGDDIALTQTGSSFSDKNAGAGKETTSTFTVSGSDESNYTWNTSAVDTADIAKASLTITADAADKVYDGNTNAGITLNFNNALGDDLSVSALSQSFDNKNAGANKAVTVGLSLSGADADNYDWNTSTVTYADITKASLSISAVASDKTYDGTTTAGVTLSDDRIAGDDLILSAGSSDFNDKNAGSGKLVIASGLNVTGDDANNYTWNTSATDVADIAKADLAITAAAMNKTYDASSAANATLSDSRVLGDDLTVSMSGASFSDKNAGNGKTVTANGITVTGADADNYTWSNTAATTADIAKANLVISAAASDKVYDATKAAEATLSDNRIGSDDLVISGSSSFVDKNAGTGKTVIVDGIAVSGSDAQNYTWNDTALATATIEKAQLDITIGAAGKDYDGTTHADAFLSDNRVAGDSITLDHASANFDNKNAGVDKTVTVDGITVTGADADNYAWNASGTTTADIGRAVLIINATGVNKTYDGTTDASSVFTDNRIGADDLTVTADTISFVDKNAEAGKQISISGISISGADASNYIWDATAVTTADITKANLDVSAIASGKTYDGNTSVSSSLTDNRIFGDNLVITSSNAFADKNAGVNKTVNIDAINVTGTDALNYNWNSSATTTATIDKAQLQIDATAGNKVYDGSNLASTSLTDNRITGDNLNISAGSSTFSDKNAGLGKTVTVGGITLSGTDAANYDWNSSAITQADITKASLIISATAQDKVYDGSVLATTTLGDNRVGADDLIITSTGSSFSDKNAADGKTVTVNGISVAGADASNYTWSNTATTNADIAKANLTVGATASDKVYDGSTSASTTLTDNRIGSDDLILSSTNSAFSDKSAADGKTVTVTGVSVTGADANNYIWNTSATTTADISKAQLDITIGAAGKDYDATTNADVFLSDNRVSGDSLAFTHDQAHFDNKNVGTDKVVTVEDIGLTGADAGNYTWNTTASTTADIGRAVLSIDATGVNKTYDGTTDASTTFSDNRLGSDDLSISADTISFVDKNADTGKQISISGITVTGADAGNYIWDTTGIATADIAKAALNITATAGGKTYDGTTGVSTSLADNRIGTDDLVITSNSAFADKNAGAGKTVNIDSINVTGADAGNYTWNATITATADIAKAQLVVTVDAASKDYDSTVHADAFLSDDRIAGDSLVLNYGSASFSDKNAGSGKTVTAEGITVTGLDAGNYEWNTSGDTTADIGRAVLTIGAAGNNKTYDGTTSATATFTDNRLGSDSLIISADEASFIDKNAETGKQISISGISVSGADAGNYIWDTTAVATADIAKANLNVTATAADKTYDGTTGVSTTLADNRFGTDDMVISSKAAFADKNAGAGKTVNVDDILVTGTDAQNYTWNVTTSTTANIGKASLQIDASATDKIYDGSNAAQSSLTDNRVLGDNLVISATNSTFSDKNAADGKVVTVSGINVTGVDAANYDWNTVASTTADIGKATLVIGAAAQDKNYDGSTSANTILSDNRVGTDNLVISSSGSTFADKNAGIGKNVSVSGLSVTGADAQNYIWNTSASSTATIAKANLVVSATASDKVYDGSSSASTILSDNRIGSDDLVLSSGSSTFSDKNAGSDKTVTVGGITATGADAQNYIVNTVTTTTADIAKAQLDVTAGAVSKDYDSTRNADVVLNDNRISGDSLSISSGQALFDTKDAGLGKNVAIGGISVTGADAGNYIWNTATSTTADIGKAILSITAAGVNKTYDGTVNGSVVLSDNRFGSDNLTIGASDVQFIDKNAATGKQMSVSGITVTGADANNYIWDGSVVATADINKAVLNVSASAQDKTYDGTTSVTGGLSDNRFGSDNLIVTGNLAFADKNAGNNKLVTVDGISVTGADANNYTWNVGATTTADIAKAVLNITTGAVSRDYDSTTNATAVLSDDRISGDSLVLGNGLAEFDNKNAGLGKTVTVNDITVTGADSGNYVWNTTGTTTADIGRAVLTINTTGVNKTYDGTNDATTTFTDNRFAGDTLTIDAGEAKFVDKNAENGKQISISGINVSGADASNYIWDATAVATADITKAALNISGLASNKVYDGNMSASTSLADNRILGDDLTVSSSTSAFADKNAGNGKTVIIGGIAVTGADASNYTWNTDTATTANIAKATLVVDAASGNKTYDSTTSATATLSDNRISGDDLSVSYADAAFADKNAGAGKTVTVNGITISGADAGNYTWNTSDTTSANINKAVLTVTASGNNKVYDGTTAGSVVLTDSRFANDDLSLSASSAFADKNAGSGKALLVTGINVTGAEASNYTWNTSTVTSADIAKAALNVGASAHNKVYDTTTGVVIDLNDNRISGDQLTISGSGSFQDKNAGAGKNVNVTGINVTGTDASNYTWNTMASASADISKANLVVSAIAGDKTYDGTTGASSSLSDNRLGSDNLVISSSGANFTDKNAGAGKSVTVNGITVSGSDAANYNWNTTAATTATINKAILTITGSALDKTYDGSRNASTTLSDNRIGSDDLNISAANSLFSDKNAGTDKVVSIDGIAVAGADAGNYTWSVSTSATADIAKANLNVVAVAQDKTYDGSNSATVGLNDNRVIGDDLVLNTSSAQFADKNAGAGKVVTVGGLTLSGADAMNYNVGSSVTTTATINKATLNVSSVAADKTYDGSTGTTAVLSDNRITGDTLSLSYGSAAFADKNAGNDKSVGVSEISVSGADAGNYTWNTTSTAVADIAKANLTITASGGNKVYDGSTAASVSLNDNRVTGDQLNLSVGTSQFDDKNAGAGKTITVGGITVTGADAANYNWNMSTSGTADITKRALAISANASDKTYDGNNSASASLSDDRVLGDNLVITSGGSTFADKNAGANKQVTVNGISVTGTDADNYTFGNKATGTATINKAVLNIGAIANDKVYDATTGATANLTDNRILGDNLIVSASGTAFSDKNAGANKAVNVSGITVSGADANNYTWNSSASSTANIAKAVLNVTANAQDKVYDGSTLAQATFNDNRLGSDNLTIGSASTSFSDKNAGVDKVVTINGIAVSGADAANYTWNASATGLADIQKANLAITATGQNKVYDTTTGANVTLSDNRVTGDNLVIGNTSAAFADKNAGAGKVITVGGITVSGADAGNYVWSGSTTATADIAKAQLTVTATANDKVYNGSTAAQTTLSDNRLTGDILTANAGSSTFADKNAGANKVVTVGGITLSGQDAANYEVNSVAVATATIDKASLIIGASASDKVYDGSTNANVSLTDNRVAGDKLTVSSGAAAFTDKNAGANKDIGISGITVGGDDSINYTWNTSATAKAAIEKAKLTISGVVQDKVYDGTTSANLTGLTDNRIAGDDLSITADGAAFANKNAGTDKVVNINGVDVHGSDSGNYEWSSIATSAAEITKAFLSLAASGKDKVYDGSSAAGVSVTDNRVSGDSLIVSVGSAAFDNKNAGQDKTITAKDITLTGEDAGNYTFANTLTTQADVHKADLEISAGDQSKAHGKNDPALSWKIDQGTLFAGDTLTGSLNRAAGEDLGTYAIEQGTLSAGDNYNLTFKPGSFEIVDAPAIAPSEIDAIVSAVSTSASKGAAPVSEFKPGSAEYRLVNLGMKLPDEMVSSTEHGSGNINDQDEVEIFN